MQPESSKDPGEISIQKLKEACELVTITKQRRHIFLNERNSFFVLSFTTVTNSLFTELFSPC